MIEIADTARLTYEMMDEGDAGLFYELDQDPEVMKYINGGKVPTMQEVYDVFLPRLAKYHNPQKGWGIWKVTEKNSKRFIGWVLVRPMAFFSENPEYDNLELGWRLKQESWGKGYATEAATAVMEAIRKAGDVRKFSAIAMPDNQGSINIMRKLGMTYLKTGLYRDPMGDEEVVFYEKILV